jgi:hypothetical protein
MGDDGAGLCGIGLHDDAQKETQAQASIGTDIGAGIPGQIERCLISIIYLDKLAEGVRFELTVDLRPRRFSRPLP